MKIKYILGVVAVVFLLISCGNRRSPTGGPVDNVRPVILHTTPLEFEQIEGNEIVLGFSKAMDRVSVMSGLHVNPAQLNRKIVWKKNDLHIIFGESLPADTNIILFLNKSIKCERGNFLEDHIVITFKNGELQDNKLSGYITINDTELVGKDLMATILDKDSLLVYHTVLSGTNFSLDYLNSGKHTLNTFIDLNNNNRFDFSIDASFSRVVELPTTQIINITPTIADTVRPNVRAVSAPFNNQISIEFNKLLAREPAIFVTDDSTHVRLAILHSEFVDKTLYMLTTQMDSTSYTVQVVGLLDQKGNENTRIERQFYANGLADTRSLTLTDFYPKNGNVLYVKSPTFSATFDKIVFAKDVVISLIEMETRQNLSLRALKETALTHEFVPERELREFNTYQFIIHKETKDTAGNEINEDIVVQFIVVG